MTFSTGAGEGTDVVWNQCDKHSASNLRHPKRDGSPLRWVSRSQRQLVKALAELGFEVSQLVVANLLRALNYSCQANSKTREGSKHPDRDAQFAHINATVKAAIIAG